MQIIDLLLNRRREKTTLAVCVVVSLVLLLLPQTAKLFLAKQSLNALFLPVQRLTHFVDDYSEIRGENRRLKRIVGSLMLERERLLQFRDERERLRQFAAFKEEQFYKLLSCEVIGRNFDRFQTTLIIDKGESDSLKTKMPVLTYQGYIGRIIEVYDHSAWVQLICSRNNPVSCLDKRSRVVGVLEWKHQSYFEFKHVGVVEDVAVGDTLITSGFGGVVPKGFPVATVTKVSRSMDGLSLKVDAKSLITFRSLEEVFVMLDRIPWEYSIIYDPADAELVRKIAEEKQ
jgi:rod shape-determining protein MreC